MLLEQIMEKDLESCYAALQQDKELQEVEAKFSDLIDETENKFEIDNLWGQYTARCIRIAYLQALKDFYKFCLTLREDTQEILKKYIDIEEMGD